MAAEVSVTFKAGGGYDAPWVVVRGSTAEVSDAISELRAPDPESGITAFQAVRVVADEFINRTGPAHTAISAAKELLGASEVTKTAAPEGPPSQQDNPPCSKCGSKTRFRSGQGTAGHYEGYSCLTDKKHFDRTK